MNYSVIEKIINYGSTYRVQEMEDLINDTAAGELADSLCGILLTFKGITPPEVWQKTVDNLLTFTTNVQFGILTEEDDGE